MSLHASVAARPTLRILESFSSFIHLSALQPGSSASLTSAEAKAVPVEDPCQWTKCSTRRGIGSLWHKSSFLEEMSSLRAKQELPTRSSLLPLHPILDSHGLLRVGGRESQSQLPYARRHPVILPGNHAVTKLIIRTEHLRLLHGGPTLVVASLSRRFHLTGCRRVV